MEPADRDPRIARYAALQSITEIGVGSLVHGLRIPLGSHLLTLNQGVLLTFAVRPDVTNGERLARRRGIAVACGVSFVTAMMKFLSPAGSRAMPALGISLQGLLFSLGIALVGLNQIGVMLGFVFLSFWAFLHPIVVAYVIFGQALFAGVVKLWTDLATKLGFPVELGIWILVGAVAGKALLSAGLAIFAWRSDAQAEARYFARIGEWNRGAPARAGAPPARSESPAWGATRDLLRPIFLVSLVISIGFVLFAGRDALGVLAYLARTIGVAWAIFFAIRAFPARWSARIRARFPVIGQTAEAVERSTTRSRN